MKLSTLLTRTILSRANPAPANPVLQLIGESGLEAEFAGLWKHFGDGLPPQREYLFARVLGRKWRFDFAWPERLVAVELEGLTHGEGGRHQRVAGFAVDCEKYNSAVMLGWRVLRFTARDLKRRPIACAEMVAMLLDSTACGFSEDR